MKYEVYHGRTVKDPTFSLDYVGKTGWDQYGPGFYFTDDENEASRFSESGGSVIKAIIEINNPLTDDEDITRQQVEFMIDNSPSVKEAITKMKNLEEGSDEYLEAFYETPLSDYDETFHSAREAAVDTYSGPLRDTMEYIWIDFYKYDSDVYLKNLLKLGYDGVIIPNEATIYVVFNPKQIKVLDVRLVESIYKDMRNFIESLKRENNKSLVESIIEGFDVIFENKITLYRGLGNKFNPNYDSSKSDAPSGYSTWTDNPELARQYAGETGHVYKIELPISELGEEYIDSEGERVLFFDNEKKAGLNNISGKEYLVYNDHDMFKPNSISLFESIDNNAIVKISEHEDKIKGGLADTMTISDIAEKHNVPVDKIISELEMGIEVEMEHTNDPEISIEIAMDHMAEIPDYYTRLDKMESEANAIHEAGNPMRPKRPPLDLKNADHKTRVMHGINSAFKGLSDRNKKRFMRNYVPNGIEIAIHSLSKLSESDLIRMKENINAISGEENDLKKSLKRESKSIRDRKKYERAMDENDKYMKKEIIATKAQGIEEQQELLDHRINSGEIDVDTLKRMRADREIDENNQIIDINAPEKSITGGAKKIGKGLKELKDSFTRKK